MRHDYIPALVLLFASLLASVYATARVDEREKQVAVLFPLQNTLQENIAIASRTNANIVRVGGNNHILILEKNSSHTTEKLYDAGALAIFNPMILGDCATKQSPTTQIN